MSDETHTEQGMDEILASIRRIISEDDSVGSHAKDEPFAGPLVLTRRVADVQAPKTAVAPAVQPEPHVQEIHILDTHVPDDLAPAPHVPPPASVQAAAPVPDAPVPSAPLEEIQPVVSAKQPVAPPDQPIVDDSAATGAASSFDKLSEAIRSTPATGPTIALPAEGRTLEDLTRDLLRPLLKAWLDEHLPSIVEARVDEEVERITRRRVR